jgi:hypothetical protein
VVIAEIHNIIGYQGMRFAVTTLLVIGHSRVCL